MSVEYIGLHNKNLTEPQQKRLTFLEDSMPKVTASVVVGFASNGFVYVFRDGSSYVTIDESGSVSKVQTCLSINAFDYLFKEKVEKEEYVETLPREIEYPTTIFFTENNGLSSCHNHLYKLVGKTLYIHTSNNVWVRCGCRAKGMNIFRNKNYVLSLFAVGQYKITERLYGEEGVPQISSKYVSGRFKELTNQL